MYTFPPGRAGPQQTIPQDPRPTATTCAKSLTLPVSEKRLVLGPGVSPGLAGPEVYTSQGSLLFKKYKIINTNVSEKVNIDLK